MAVRTIPVREQCRWCTGSGYTPCTNCQLGAYPAPHNRKCDSCQKCHGTNRIKCSSCQGTGYVVVSEVRTWVPDSVAETQELIDELAEAMRTGENGWTIINALRRGYQFCTPAERRTCFPVELVDRINGLKTRLAPPSGRAHFR
jgi:hypothetical protein